MASELLNVCLQIIEALIAFFFYESVSQLSKGKIKRVSIIIIGYLIMCAINLFFNYNVIINNLALLIFHFLFSYLLYKQKIGISVFYSVIFTCLIMASETGVIYIITAFTGSNPRSIINNITLYSIVIVFSKALLFLALKIIGNIINAFKSNEKFDFEFYIYPTVLLIIMIVFVIISYKNELSPQSNIILSASSIILIFTIIITCILQQQSASRKSELLELRAIKQKQNIENTYFELLEHQNEELQIFVHDMKKHLDNIYNLSSDSENIKKYISSLSTDLTNSNEIGKTSNKLLDLIINKYNFITQKNGIEFEKNIHSSDLSFINDKDLTSIFNNLLDNSVEAANKSKEKNINLSINTFGNILTIYLSNSCDTPPVLKHNILVSTKQDQGMHGYGFKSITRSVKKYEGDIEWDYNKAEKTFNVSILFQRA